MNKTPHKYRESAEHSHAIQVMNALLILDAKEIVQNSSKDKSETLSLICMSRDCNSKPLVVANIKNDSEKRCRILGLLALQHAFHLIQSPGNILPA